MTRFHKLQIGDAELVSLQDASVVMPPGQLFPDVPADSWRRYVDFNDPNGKLLVNFGAWAIISQDRVILVDTGLGERAASMLPEPPCLPDSLQAAGIRPADVDTIVYTHLHSDHTGWNTVDRGGKPALLFPNARHVIQRAEWEFWASTAANQETAHFDTALRPVEAAGLLDLVDGEYAVTSEVVTVPTPGHTPGHVSFVVTSGGEHAYILGDAAHHPAQVQETDWSPGADFDKAMSAASRRALFERIEREGAVIAGGHFPFPGLGRAASANGERVFRPIG